jgi:hypothetical protein
MNFYETLREKLNKVPVKMSLIKDLEIQNNHTGLRYFLQEKKDKPSMTVMEKLCEKIDYQMMVIPVKNGSNSEEIKKLHTSFFEDLDKYLEKYAGEKERVYTKKFGERSAIADATRAFDDSEVPDEVKIDVSDLF